MTQPSQRRIHAPPRAAAMIEALRGLGYSPGTAIADIIDNSITAGASNVQVDFRWDMARSSVAVRDNGRGMSRDELVKAMRLGDRSPVEARAADDLGRFGLGLKTASFSQARRLTVASRRNGEVSVMRWDLDLLADSTDDGWYLLEGADPESALDLRLGADGTIVAWEKLDRIVTAGFTSQDFLDLIDSVEAHLALTFHRFLSGGGRQLVLQVNGSLVKPISPFLEAHPATWSSPVARLPSASGLVEVQCHVLPHRDRLDSGALERVGGPDGWTAQQGFYVYRNRRLLVAGSWLGLGRGRAWTKEEAHRLARIRIDIPNSADADWKIDIRKSTARPPVGLKDHLTLLAEDTRERARRVFAHRGRPSRQASSEIVQAWRVEHFSGGIRYRIDESHPAVQAVLDGAGDLLPDVRAMIRVIEETVPVQRIWLDTTEARETPRTGFSADPPEEVLRHLEILYRNFVKRKGMSPSLARARLRTTEPFDGYPELVDNLPEKLDE